MADLAGEKTIYYGFTGPIDSDSATRIATAFNHAANENYDHVYLTFSSLGGFVADGVYLYNTIRALPMKTTFHNIGSVCSIATAVFVAADERVCSKHGTFMIHPTSMNPTEGMTAERLDAFLTATLTEEARTEAILRERTSIPEDLLSARRFKDVHISPVDAAKHGLVHRVEEFSLPSGVGIFQI